MKRSLQFIIPAVLAFNISNAHALEIDEKLTLRFLKVSSSKKTVLINRGGEDGLVVGDHAKFFITAGVIARGVAEKVSPSRSVWSLYRVVDPTEITDDKVLNLKIATPVKITEDPSKSLKEEPIPGGTDAMPTEDEEVKAAPADGGELVVSDADKDELKDLGFDDEGEATASAPAKSTSKSKSKTPAKTKGKKSTTSAKQTSVMEEDETPSYSNNNSKTWEVWGLVYVNSLTGTSGGETDTSSSTAVTASTVDFSAGLEKYFVNYNNFLKEFSVSVFAHKKTIESGDSVKSKADWFEYGGGVNYHFYHSAGSINKLIGYAAVTAGAGSATLKSTVTTNGVETPEDKKGTNTFFSAGVGAKYVLQNGFGIRALFDYYSSSESYDTETETDTTTTTRTLAGPRIQFGLSYRF